MYFIFLFIVTLLVVLITFQHVNANGCVDIDCPTPMEIESVCGVDEAGIIKRFASECILRKENCEKKTSEYIYSLEIN